MQWSKLKIENTDTRFSVFVHKTKNQKDFSFYKRPKYVIRTHTSSQLHIIKSNRLFGKILAYIGALHIMIVFDDFS